VLGFLWPAGKSASSYPAKQPGEHQKETTMEEKEGRSEHQGIVEKPETIESPSEKLEGTPPTGSLVPGPENPESEEIKKEVNPNTE
jgi:hypothetical protein